MTVLRGVTEAAICYNLPPNKLVGTNSAYAESLPLLATRLEFPEEYQDTIRMERDLGWADANGGAVMSGPTGWAGE